MKISDFVAKINSSGIAKPTRYLVTFPASQLAQLSTQIYNLEAKVLNDQTAASDWYADYYGGNASGESLMLQAFCTQSSLPGMQFQVDQHRIYGPSFKFPVMREVQEITMTFLCTNSMNERYFFESWMFMALSPSHNNSSYRSEFCVPVEISLLDDTNTIIYSTTLTQCFPLSISSQNLSFSSVNEPLQLEVTFSFRDTVPYNTQATSSTSRGKPITFSQTITN